MLFFHVINIAYLSFHISSIRNPLDLQPGDFRSALPRFTAENFEQNVKLADKFKAFGAKYNATGAQIILAWILAEHPDSEF